MYDAGKVIVGLIILFAFVTFPFFYNGGKAAEVPEPKIDTPVIKKIPEKERRCIESTRYMRENHMTLLDEWRNMAVRYGDRDYVGFTGKKYTVSLQNECLHCHSNYDKFCDQCHSFMGIKPYCWGCHVEKPEEWAKGELEKEK